ncbi:hypothetical protein FXO37_15752 [Capsicum annuum]|nr:hypothetical protein FXO37_15752 [Capsicum annuum]
MLHRLIDFAAEPIPMRRWYGREILHMGLLQNSQEDYCREEYDKGKRVVSSSRGLENEVLDPSYMLLQSFSEFYATKEMCKPYFPEKCTVQRSLGSAGYTKPQNLQKTKITEHRKRPTQSSKCPGGSSILEHRSPNAVNESRMIPMTHLCDPALDPSWKSEDVYHSVGIHGYQRFGDENAYK